MINCPLCFKKLNDRKGFSAHLTHCHKNEFSSPLEKERIIVYTLFGEALVSKIITDYVEEKYSIYELPIDIVNLLKFMGLKRTSKEERQTQRYKQKYLSGIQKKYGNEITNISQVKEIQLKKERTVSKNFGSYDNYLKNQRINMRCGYEAFLLDEERAGKTYSNIKKSFLNKYGVDNPSKLKEVRIKNSIESKNRFAKMTLEERRLITAAARAAVSSRGGFSSGIEKRIRDILLVLNVASEYNKPLWNYNWDFVLDGFPILIEVQGIMWHAKPTLYRSTDLIMGKILVSDIWEKDKRKKLKALQEGFSVLEIWEDEIRCRSDDELLIFVKEGLIKYGYVFTV